MEDSDIHHAIRNDGQLQVISSHILYKIFKRTCFEKENHDSVDEEDGEHHHHDHKEELPKATSFVENILSFYGNKSSMTAHDFKELYKGLKLGEVEELSGGDHDGHEHKRKRRRRKRREIHDDDLNKVKLLYNACFDLFVSVPVFVSVIVHINVKFPFYDLELKLLILYNGYIVYISYIEI